MSLICNMIYNSKLINELNNNEVKEGMYDITIGDLPLWRLVRFKFRIEYLKKHTGATNKSETLKANKLEVIKYIVISFFQYIKLLLFPKNAKNFIFAFPRLNKIGDSFIDKFSDPVIEYSDLKESSIVFQHSFSRSHYMPRANSDIVIYTDFIDIFSRIISKVLKYYYKLKYKEEINNLLNKTDGIYTDVSISKDAIAEMLSTFLIYIKLYDFVFKLKKPKNVFIVSREVFKFALYLGHKYDCKVFELQHGITQTETAMYTGPYQVGFDPDFFLVFGGAWRNEFYGIPRKSIFNIGWAYRDYVNSFLTNHVTNSTSTFLVISSPAITQEIVNFTLKAKSFNPRLSFNIRLHPQEKLTTQQKISILNCEGIQVLDNKEESVFTIAKHHFILGDNSSVLYEALSMGKKVGKINMYNMFSRNVEEDIRNGFFIIKEFANLEQMQSSEEISTNDYYYSKFNKDIFNKLIK